MGSFSNLKIKKQIAYGAGFMAYNLGGSIPVGLIRIGVTGCYIGRHAYRVVWLRRELPSETVRRVSNRTESHIAEQTRTKVTDYRSTHDQYKFWAVQVIRGLTEIFLPVIASFGWTLRDLTVETSKINKQHKNGDFTLNIAGINDLRVGCEWEADTWSAMKVQRKAPSRQTAKKTNWCFLSCCKS